jgi:hypothetical protein
MSEPEGMLFLGNGGPIQWSRPMLQALDLCVRKEMSATATARTLGVEKGSLARGAMILLRLRQLGERL